MENFLFFDGLRGEYFVVNAGIMEEAWDEACLIVDDKDELDYLGTCTEEEIDSMGYEVY